MFDVIIESTVEALVLEIGTEHHFVIYVINKGAKRSLTIFPKFDEPVDQIDASLCRTNDVSICIDAKLPQKIVTLDM